MLNDIYYDIIFKTFYEIYPISAISIIISLSLLLYNVGVYFITFFTNVSLIHNIFIFAGIIYILAHHQFYINYYLKELLANSIKLQSKISIWKTVFCLKLLYFATILVPKFNSLNLFDKFNLYSDLILLIPLLNIKNKFARIGVTGIQLYLFANKIFILNNYANIFGNIYCMVSFITILQLNFVNWQLYIDTVINKIKINKFNLISDLSKYINKKYGIVNMFNSTTNFIKDFMTPSSHISYLNTCQKFSDTADKYTKFIELITRNMKDNINVIALTPPFILQLCMIIINYFPLTFLHMIYMHDFNKLYMMLETIIFAISSINIWINNDDDILLSLAIDNKNIIIIKIAQKYIDTLEPYVENIGKISNYTSDCLAVIPKAVNIITTTSNLISRFRNRNQ
jgi:hypothetical protein